MRHLADCNKPQIVTVLLLGRQGSFLVSLERGEMGKDGVVALLATRYCRKPQALELGVESRQAVKFAMNVMFVGVFQTFPAQLHGEEFGQIGEVHFQEAVLLQLLEFDANGKELDDAASLVTLEPLCRVGFRVGLGGSIHCPRGGNFGFTPHAKLRPCRKGTSLQG